MSVENKIDIKIFLIWVNLEDLIRKESNNEMHMTLE